MASISVFSSGGLYWGIGAPVDYQVLCQKIESAYQSMSPRLKRAARYVLDNPDDVALLSMRQLAARADIHPSSMSRLSRELGLSGYADLQRPFQSRLRTRPAEPYSENARSIQNLSSSSRSSLIHEMLELEHANLDALASQENIDEILKCAELIKAARRVFIGGVRTSYPAAFFLYYALRMVNDKVMLLDGRGGTFADDLRNIGESDVLIATSFSPYSRNVVRAVQFAADHGAQIIAITDSKLSPLTQVPNVTPLILRTESPSIFHSVVPAMAAVQTLFVLLLADGGVEALAELSESEIQLKAFDAYWTDDTGMMKRDAK